MTKRQKLLERMHLLQILATYGPLLAARLADRANQECEHDAFEDLQEINPRGITAKLNAMSSDGLLMGLYPGDGQPMLWQVTDRGRRVLEAFLVEEAKSCVAPARAASDERDRADA